MVSPYSKGCKLKYLRRQAHHNHECSQLDVEQWDRGQSGRVCPIEGINHFLGSVARYLDLLLLQEKLEIFLRLPMD